MNAVSRWFNIDTDGQPTLPGWYEVAYGYWDEDCDRLYWDGAVWRHEPEDEATDFGNRDTHDESWRGLAGPADSTGSQEEVNSGAAS